MFMRCIDCRGSRKNPGDADLRRLERAAISGDIDAARQLSLEKHRRGLCGDGEDCWQCQVAKMQNDSRTARQIATKTLGKIGDPAAIPALVETMHDSDLYVRLWAAFALKNIGPAAIPALVKVMQNDSNKYVSELAAVELGEIGDPAAIPALVETMKNDRWWDVRRAAAEALGKIGDPAAIPALVETMQNDSHWYVRQYAAETLKKLRDIGAAKPGQRRRNPRVIPHDLLITCKICGNFTKKDKPYCEYHADKTNYARFLQEKIKQNENEVERVGLFGVEEISENSITIKDIISQLREYGPQTIESLANLIDVNIDTTSIYCDYLLQKKLLGWTKIKSNWYVALIEQLPQKPRSLTRRQVASLLNINAPVLRKWVRKGAPHDVIRSGHAGWPVKLFNLEELIKWKDNFSKEARRKGKIRRCKTLGGVYMPKKQHPDKLWEDVMKDAYLGVPRRAIARKYKVGQKAIDDYMKDHGLWKPHRVSAEQAKNIIKEIKSLSGLSLHRIEELYNLKPKSLKSCLASWKTVPKEMFDKLSEILATLRNQSV